MMIRRSRLILVGFGDKRQILHTPIPRLDQKPENDVRFTNVNRTVGTVQRGSKKFV